MYQTNAYNAYSQNNIGIESPQKLIEILFEGILRFNAQAKRAIRDNNIEKRTYWINRSNAIFVELINALDPKQGNISTYLNGLYTYQLQLLSQANIKNSETDLDQVSQVVKGLLEAWKDETHVD